MTDVGTAALAITQGIGAFNNFLPKLSEVRKHSINDPEFVADVRVGEFAAAALTVGVGAMVSSLTGDPVPTILAFIMAVGLIVLYESTLRADRPMEPKTTHTGPATVTTQEG